MTQKVDLMSQNSSHEALLLIGHGSRDGAGVAEYYQFAEHLAGYLHLPVYPCFLEFAGPPIVAGIRACIEAGAGRIVALPLFLGPAGHQKNDVPTIINWAKSHWPAVEFHYGAPLGAHYGLVAALAERAQETIAAHPTTIPASETAILVVGRGSRDPDSNSDVYKIARMLWEGRDYGWVEAAFYSLTPPNLAEGVERCRRLGARRVVALPYLLFTGRIGRRLAEQAQAAQLHYPDLEILTAQHLGHHPGVLAVVEQRYREALAGSAAMSCDLCKYRHRFAGFEDEYGLPQISDHHHGLRGVAHHHE